MRARILCLALLTSPADATPILDTAEVQLLRNHQEIQRLKEEIAQRRAERDRQIDEAVEHLRAGLPWTPAVAVRSSSRRFPLLRLLIQPVADRLPSGGGDFLTPGERSPGWAEAR